MERLFGSLAEQVWWRIWLEEALIRAQVKGKPSLINCQFYHHFQGPLSKIISSAMQCM